ncbi:unnamed protein product [Eruca vesicaria subsp. sativa]|uniref:tRNA/rRNA methyltransferase SpoU type domain-containing protein n=1 Tax=Eruca vesicaria subsp. sativa TaxID=29727 RepID=A0ABC8JY33_ERUVS|nr:unnamed protein product [Eruca vesicaria subsp. sativa]
MHGSRNEGSGISDEALELADLYCSIPMKGMVDSFNVSVTWTASYLQIIAATPLDLHSAAALINQRQLNSTKALVIKLVLQSAIYLIWRERNARIFTSTTTSASGLRRALDRLIRDRLISFPSSDQSPSSLQFYFSCTQPP